MATQFCHVEKARFPASEFSDEGTIHTPQGKTPHPSGVVLHRDIESADVEVPRDE